MYDLFSKISKVMEVVSFCTRSVYLITYTQTDTAKIASRIEFSETETNAFSKNRKVKLSRHNAHHALKIVHIPRNVL